MVGKRVRILCTFLMLSFLLSTESASSAILCKYFLRSKQNIEGRLLRKWLRAEPIQRAPTRIGFEWEGQIPVEVNSLELRDAIGRKLKKIYPSKAVFYEESSGGNAILKYFIKGTPKVFTILGESFSADIGYEPMEVNSPILSNYKELKLIGVTLKSLKELGIKTSTRGGIHWHFDGADVTMLEFEIYMKVVRALMPQIREKWGIHPNRSIYLDDYFESETRAIRRQANELLPQGMAKLTGFFPQDSRFVQFKKDKKTVETRVFDATLDEELVMEMLVFTKALFDGILAKDPWVVDLLVQGRALKLEDFMGHEIHF